MRALIFLMIFFICGGLLILENNNLALHESENISKFNGLYFSWLGSLAANTISLTGNIVKTNWLPTNLSESNAT